MNESRPSNPKQPQPLEQAGTLEGISAEKAREIIAGLTHDLQTAQQRIQELEIEAEQQDRRINVLEHDGLTGVLRREIFEEKSKQLIEDLHPERGTRQHDAVVLLFVDIIDLGKMNKLYSHAEGDRAISVTAAGIEHGGHLLQQRLRSSDIVGRRGGDEFLCAIALNLGSIDKDYTVESEAERAANVVISHLGITQLKFEQPNFSEDKDIEEENKATAKLGFRIGYSVITSDAWLSFEEAEAKADPKGMSSDRARILTADE